MKKIWALAVLCILAVCGFSQPQQKHDVVLKLNGEENTGKVLEIDESSIKFTFQGESLVYVIKKQDILKITYGSGRIEFINKPLLPSETGSSNRNSPAAEGIALHHNKVAILPFKYIIDKRDAGEEMTFKVQTEAFTFLNNHIGNLELQIPNTTNALLIKAGVSNNNIRGFTMGEICNILGVEYIVQGIITQDRTSTNAYQRSSSSYKNKDASGMDRGGNIIGSIFGSSGSRNSSTVSTSTQNYKTSVTMNVFNDKGQSTFNQNHDSFWNTTDAYKITLQYLLKRTPVYHK